MEGFMRRSRLLWVGAAALAGLSMVPCVTAQSGEAAPAQISGVVQSFNGETLDIKPATSPAVWVMVPADVHVDRSAVKAGAQVSVEARWDGLVYIATEVSAKK
jgi:hypothetical protein